MMFLHNEYLTIPGRLTVTKIIRNNTVYYTVMYSIIFHFYMHVLRAGVWWRFIFLIKSYYTSNFHAHACFVEHTCNYYENFYSTAVCRPPDPIIRKYPNVVLRWCTLISFIIVRNVRIIISYIFNIKHTYIIHILQVDYLRLFLAWTLCRTTRGSGVLVRIFVLCLTSRVTCL